MWKRNWEFFLRCFSLELATDYLTVAMNWGQFSEKFFGLRILRNAKFMKCEMRIKYTIIGVWYVRYTPSKKICWKKKIKYSALKSYFDLLTLLRIFNNGF